jgi:hypothetical protein
MGGGAIRMSDLPSRPSEVSQSINLVQSKRIQDVFSKDAWKGRRCFVVGGGPSLKGFKFGILKKELVVTVNRGLEFCPSSAINLCTDARVWGWYENIDGGFGQEAKDKFHAYKGCKVWVNVQQFPFPEDIYVINPIAPSDFTFAEYYRGIPIYSNSGVNALMLAACLGANPIYLLGFDLYGEEGRTANFHPGYPEGSNKEDLYNFFLDDFKDAELKLRNHTKVINLNPDSKLPYFEFGDIKSLKLGARSKNG